MTTSRNTNKKLRIAWLCHFANARIAAHLKSPPVNEFAPWINKLIMLFERCTDVELHVVAPNVYNNREVAFEIAGVHYHLYPAHHRVLPRKIRTLMAMMVRGRFVLQTKTIRKIITSIMPDLIHLHGAENPYYSAGILDLLGRYPVVITIQGFARNTTQRGLEMRNRIRIEEEILRRATHFGSRTLEMDRTIKSLNPGAVLHFHEYPLHQPTVHKKKQDNETYDCLFYGRVTKDKGIEDFLHALALLRVTRPGISARVIGQASAGYQKYLDSLCKNLNIDKNVRFLGFFKEQNDIFRYALDARLYVLPTHYDAIPGTIIESMFLRLPVLAYAVGGIPELNVREKCVETVEKGDIASLSLKIEHLLLNPNERQALADAAFSLALIKYGDETVVTQIMATYKNVLAATHREQNTIVNHGQAPAR